VSNTRRWALDLLDCGKASGGPLAGQMPLWDDLPSAKTPDSNFADDGQYPAAAKPAPSTGRVFPVALHQKTITGTSGYPPAWPGIRAKTRARTGRPVPLLTAVFAGSLQEISGRDFT